MTFARNSLSYAIAAVLLSACGAGEETEDALNPGGQTDPNMVTSALQYQVKGGTTTLVDGYMPRPSRNGVKPVLSGAPATLQVEDGEKSLLLYTVTGGSTPRKLYIQVRGSDKHYEIDLPASMAKVDGATQIIVKSEVELPDESDGDEDYCTDTSVGDDEGQVSDPEETCTETDPEDGEDIGGGEPEEPVDDGSARVCFFPYMAEAQLLYVDPEGQQYRTRSKATSVESKADDGAEPAPPSIYTIVYDVNNYYFTGQAALTYDEEMPAIYDVESHGYAAGEFIHNEYSPGLPLPFYLFPGQTLTQQISKRSVSQTGEVTNSNFTYEITHTGRRTVQSYTGETIVVCDFVANIGDTTHYRSFAYESGALMEESVRYQGDLYSSFSLIGGSINDEWLY